MRERKVALQIVFLVAFSCSFARAQTARDIYVAPNGSPNGSGSMSNPMDLASALRGDRIKPGATVWLRGGTYSGVFTSNLTGTASAPITVRGFPGERAIITDNRSTGKGGTLNIFGGWTIYRDFEITNRSQERGMFNQYRPMGLEVQAPYTKFIDLIIYDTGHGFGFWKEAVNSEIYGCIIFNGGTLNSRVALRHGHGIYTQNNMGTKHIRDNIIFNQFGWGIHGYPNPGHLTGFDIEGNIIFNNGINSDRGYRFPSIMVSGYRPHTAGHLRIANNFTYESADQRPLKTFSDANLCLGCSDKNVNEDATVRDNHFVGGEPVAAIANFLQVTMTGNLFYGQSGMAGVAVPEGASIRSYHWDNNRYYGAGADGSRGALFSYNGKVLDFKQWRDATGLDKDSTFSPGRPTGVDVFVRPNDYESGRANIVVYNWDRRDYVEANLSNVLRPGSSYEIYNVQDLFGSPVVSGEYIGGTVRLPMGPVRVAAALGKPDAPPPTGPDFNAFLVRTVSGRSQPPQQVLTTVEPAQKTPPPEVPRATGSDLSKYVGTYSSKRARIVVTLNNDRLVAQFMHERGQPSYGLRQVSSGKFQLEGAPPGFLIEFYSSAQRMKVVRSVLPSVDLARER